MHQKVIAVHANWIGNIQAKSAVICLHSLHVPLCRSISSADPLVVDGVAYGLAAWGRGCAQSKFPGVYVRVPVFSTWIRENLNPRMSE